MDAGRESAVRPERNDAGGGRPAAGCAATERPGRPIHFHGPARATRSQIGKAGGEGSRRENVNSSPGSLTMRNVSLSSCIRWAYNVKQFQVSGPAWLESERYDVLAKAADPAPTDQLRLML